MQLAAAAAQARVHARCDLVPAVSCGPVAAAEEASGLALFDCACIPLQEQAAIPRCHTRLFCLHEEANTDFAKSIGLRI